MVKRGRKKGKKSKKITESKSERKAEKITVLKADLKAVKKAHEHSIGHSRKTQKINIELRNAIEQCNDLIDLLAFTETCPDAKIRKTAMGLVNTRITATLNNIPKEDNSQKSE